MTIVASVAVGAVRLGGAWIAAQPGDYDPSSGHGPDWGKAAPAGLLVWLFLGVCLFFLVKSMNRHLKKVRAGSVSQGVDAGRGQHDDGAVDDAASGRPDDDANIDAGDDAAPAPAAAGGDAERAARTGSDHEA